MGGAYFIAENGQRIGTVMKFVGEPKERRWAAYSIHRLSADKENRAAFPTMKAAIAWLKTQHKGTAQ